MTTMKIPLRQLAASFWAAAIGAAVSLGLLAASAGAGPLTVGNLVLMEVAGTVNSAGPITIRELSTTGSTVQSFPVDSGNGGGQISATATSEGQLSLNASGDSWTVGVYVPPFAGSGSLSGRTAAQAFVAGKKVRSLASAGETRNPVAPDVPTFAEQGLKDFEFTAWTAVFAPAGTPTAIAERLNAAIIKISDSAEMAQLRSKAGSTAMVMDLPAGKRFVAREVASWKKYVDETGIKPEQ